MEKKLLVEKLESIRLGTIKPGELISDGRWFWKREKSNDYFTCDDPIFKGFKLHKDLAETFFSEYGGYHNSEVTDDNNFREMSFNGSSAIRIHMVYDDGCDPITDVLPEVLAAPLPVFKPKENEAMEVREETQPEQTPKRTWPHRSVDPLVSNAMSIVYSRLR